MSNLTVWAFDAAGDADSALLVLEGLADRGAIELHDAAAVSWQAGTKGPSTTRLRHHESNALDDSLIRSLEAQVPRNRSALLVRSSHGNFDEIRRAFRWSRNRLLSSDVDADTAAQLREVLGP